MCYNMNYLSTGCTDGEVRLIGGSSETEGTVEVCHNKTWGMVSGLGWGEEDARVICRQLQLPVKGLMPYLRTIVSVTICTAGFHSYVDSPFGKPRQTVHFSAVQCVGNESRITDCPTTNNTYEQGKPLAEHLAVAGVACKQCYCECPVTTQIVTLRPTQQTQLDSDNSQQLTITTILLTGLAAIFGTLSVTLATW